MRLPSSKTGINVRALLTAGVEAGIREGDEQEKLKIGFMRGASQGILLSDGNTAGPCPRASHARMLGAQPPRPADWVDKHTMFDSGHANEDSWVKNLERSWDGIILRESDVPVKWEVEGVQGSGRPDIVLAYADNKKGGTPYLLPDGRDVWLSVGIENKQVSSVNTAAGVMFEDGRPKLEHAIQAGRYMLQLGCNWQIWYSLPFVCPIPSWPFVTSKIPAAGERYSDRVDYSNFKGSSKPSKIQPHSVGYHLAFHDGTLHYSRVGEEADGWVETIITIDSLDAYWSAVLSQPEEGLLPKNKVVDILGDTGYYDPCNYCSWEFICSKAGDEYEEWRAAIEPFIPEKT